LGWGVGGGVGGWCGVWGGLNGRVCTCPPGRWPRSPATGRLATPHWRAEERRLFTSPSPWPATTLFLYAPLRIPHRMPGTTVTLRGSEPLPRRGALPIARFTEADRAAPADTPRAPSPPGSTRRSTHCGDRIPWARRTGPCTSRSPLPRPATPEGSRLEAHGPAIRLRAWRRQFRRSTSPLTIRLYEIGFEAHAERSRTRAVPCSGAQRRGR